MLTPNSVLETLDEAKSILDTLENECVTPVHDDVLTRIAILGEIAEGFTPTAEGLTPAEGREVRFGLHLLDIRVREIGAVLVSLRLGNHWSQVQVAAPPA